MSQAALFPPTMSRGEGTSADEGRFRKIPTPVLGIIVSFLTDEERRAATFTNHSLEKRVSPYLDPKKLRADIFTAAEQGNLDAIKVLMPKFQSSCKASARFKDASIKIAAGKANDSLHPQVQNHLLSYLPTTTVWDKFCNICRVSCLYVFTCGVPACYRACENVEGDE